MIIFAIGLIPLCVIVFALIRFSRYYDRRQEELSQPAGWYYVICITPATAKASGGVEPVYRYIPIQDMYTQARIEHEQSCGRWL